MSINTGTSLRVAQAKAKISGSQLARDFDVHPQQVMRWRNNVDMKVSLAIRFAHYFEVTLGEFIGFGEDHG
jgi:hypothetical protein|tara:strand:- start:118 stop:330 length:213 start_codon:yes stop_codon:yes gene_type:complete